MTDLIDHTKIVEYLAALLLELQGKEFGQLKNNTWYYLSCQFQYKHPFKFESDADVIIYIPTLTEVI